MKHGEKEIVDALNVIQDICLDNACNDECPFYDGYVCVIRDEKPNDWEIVEVTPTFKAFK